MHVARTAPVCPLRLHHIHLQLYIIWHSAAFCSNSMLNLFRWRQVNRAVSNRTTESPNLFKCGVNLCLNTMTSNWHIVIKIHFCSNANSFSKRHSACNAKKYLTFDRRRIKNHSLYHPFANMFVTLYKQKIAFNSPKAWFKIRTRPPFSINGNTISGSY